MSKSIYLEVSWNCIFPEDESEILTSLLLNIGFDSFSEIDGKYSAFIEKNLYNEVLLKETLDSFPFTVPVNVFQVTEQSDKNWNLEWESHYEPVIVADKILVKAPFHTIESTQEYCLTIQPQMSFGTGHHETTAGMLTMMLELDFKAKQVIDMGAGTGILTVFASQLGAAHILAVDIDEICLENMKENFRLNSIQSATPSVGDIEQLKGKSADILLANINRNILLNQIPVYAEVVRKGGELLLSGFYQSDEAMITNCCEKNGFIFQKSIYNKSWTIALYNKL